MLILCFMGVCVMRRNIWGTSHFNNYCKVVKNECMHDNINELVTPLLILFMSICESLFTTLDYQKKTKKKTKQNKNKTTKKTACDLFCVIMYSYIYNINFLVPYSCILSSLYYIKLQSYGIYKYGFLHAW